MSVYWQNGICKAKDYIRCIPHWKKGTTMKKQKKNGVIKLFFISLFKSLLCIVAILGVGFISYKISYSILSNSEKSGKIDVGSLEEDLNNVTTDEISKNLIYVSDEKNKITHIMLEICNTKTNNMDYVTIPVKTDYTIPSVMYRKLCQINQEIPQVIRLSRLRQYFTDENDAYGYGVLIFEKMLGTDISYYTAISEQTYQRHYTQQRVRVVYKTDLPQSSTPDPNGIIPSPDPTVRTKMKISILNDVFKNELAHLTGSQDKITDYIKEQYDNVVSNLTVYNKLGYVESYQKMNVSLYHYWGIPGTNVDGVFEIDAKAAKKALKSLAENTSPYTIAQDLTAPNKINLSSSSGTSSRKNVDTPETPDDSENVASSKDLNIYVRNGSQVAGLASATKDKLQNAGYTVTGIGNYTIETLQATKIIVKENGQGRDLKEYFNNPELTVGDVTEGYDIEIIIGTNDAD